MSIFSVLANEGCWGLNELILPHLSDQDLCAMRLTCQRFKNFIDSQKFWYERILVAILKKTDDITMTEIIQKVLDTKDVKKMQELTGLYLRMDYKIHSPLWQLAAQEGFLEVFEFCWNWSDGRVFRDGWENKSALHMAAGNGHINVVHFLFERIKDMNLQDNGGWTPLHEAAFSGHIDVVHFLFERIKDKNPQDNTGWTPLHGAAQNGHIDVVRFLVDRIKDKNPQDNHGHTPLYWATRLGHTEIVRFYQPNINQGPL